MEVYPDLPDYYRRMGGTEIVSDSLTSNKMYTGLRMPAWTTTSENRSQESGKSICRNPWGKERECGALAQEEPGPESEPPRISSRRHQHFGFGGEPWPSCIPIRQFYHLTQNKKSNLYNNDSLLPKPLNTAAQPLNMEFPVGHPYQTHISRFAMFPTFTSPKDVSLGLSASPQQPFPTTTFTRTLDRATLRKSKGKPSQDEKPGSPPGSPKKALHRSGQNIYYNLSKCIHKNAELFYPKYPKLLAPSTTLTTSDPFISLKRANIQKNLERSHWITSYSHDFTGSGSMNPLELDDLHEKKVAILTGKIGFDPPPQARSHPEFTPSRPSKGRIARCLQGRRPRASIVIEQGIPMCPDCTPRVLCTVHSLVPSHAEMMLVKGSTPAGPVLRQSQISEIEEMIRHGVMPPSPYDFPPHSKTEEDDDTDDFYKIYERPPYPKITDTYRNDALYWRQVLIRPPPKQRVEPEGFLCYENMKPSRLDQYIVWQNTVSLSKPSILPALTGQKPPFNPDPWFINQSQVPPQIPDAESQKENDLLLKWTPSAGVSRPQTCLLQLQNSFSKSDAHRRLHESFQEDGREQ